MASKDVDSFIGSIPVKLLRSSSDDWPIASQSPRPLGPLGRPRPHPHHPHPPSHPCPHPPTPPPAPPTLPPPAASRGAFFNIFFGKDAARNFTIKHSQSAKKPLPNTRKPTKSDPFVVPDRPSPSNSATNASVHVNNVSSSDVHNTLNSNLPQRHNAVVSTANDISNTFSAKRRRLLSTPFASALVTTNLFASFYRGDHSCFHSGR